MPDASLTRNEAERQQAEESLRERAELLRVLTDHASDFIRLHDLDGRSVYASPSVERLHGRVPATLFEFVHPEDLATCQRWWEKILAGETDRLNRRERDGGGHWRWLETSAALVRYHDRPHVLTVCRDITDRKRAEEQSRVDAERLRAVVAAAPMVIWAIDRSGIKTLSVGKLLEKWGRKENELVGQSIFEAAKDVPAMLDAARRVLNGETMAGVTTVETETFEWWYYPLRGDDGAITGAFGVAIDVTDRKRAEDALRESERLLRQVLDAIPVGVAVTNRSGDIVLSNPAARRIWGGMITTGAERYAKSKAWWHDTGKRIGPDEWASARAFTQEQTTVNELIDIEAFDGVRKIIKNSAAPIRGDEGAITGAVFINENVTDVLRLEDQLRQAQKMEAVGHLAGGVAHDFNNLLTIINGYSEILLPALSPTDPAREMLVEIRQAGERAAGLTRQLLAFSRRTVLEPKVLDLNDVVRENEKMLRRLIGEDVQLTAVLDPALEPVKVDPGQISQVIINLAVNARDAMPTGGKLNIETGNVKPGEAPAVADPEAKPGRQVRLAVTDTGTGMTPEVRAHIFEPFFTTKQPGKGTGLGLATVYGIVKQSGGSISVSSEPGRGTAFKIYFPVAEGRVSAGNSLPGLKPVVRGTETILLVEDEDAVRAMVRVVLQQAGYTVLEANRGTVAIRLVQPG